MGTVICLPGVAPVWRTRAGNAQNNLHLRLSHYPRCMPCGVLFWYRRGTHRRRCARGNRFPSRHIRWDESGDFLAWNNAGQATRGALREVTRAFVLKNTPTARSAAHSLAPIRTGCPPPLTLSR